MDLCLHQKSTAIPKPLSIVGKCVTYDEKWWLLVYGERDEIKGKKSAHILRLLYSHPKKCSTEYFTSTKL